MVPPAKIPALTPANIAHLSFWTHSGYKADAFEPHYNKFRGREKSIWIIGHYSVASFIDFGA